MRPYAFVIESGKSWEIIAGIKKTYRPVVQLAIVQMKKKTYWEGSLRYTGQLAPKRKSFPAFTGFSPNITEAPYAEYVNRQFEMRFEKGWSIAEKYLRKVKPYLGIHLIGQGNIYSSECSLSDVTAYQNRNFHVYAGITPKILIPFRDNYNVDISIPLNFMRLNYWYGFKNDTSIPRENQDYSHFEYYIQPIQTQFRLGIGWKFSKKRPKTNPDSSKKSKPC